MIAEAIDKILSLGKNEELVFPGRLGVQRYSTKRLFKVDSPFAETVNVHTLTGLCDLIRHKLSGADVADYFLHVASHDTVHMLPRATNEWGGRPALVTAVAEHLDAVDFGRFHEVEHFIIGLQAAFEVTPDLKYVLGIASNISSSTEVSRDDDGVAQRATVRTGVALKQEVVVKPRVRLQPFRTFREVQQPSSEFIFRIRPDGGAHKCALFEADGGRWKLDAMLEIATWLYGRGLNIDIAA